MPDITALIQHGSTNLWLFIPSAILLGALHGLEPGHSKTMMAAFIIAVRGSVAQAVLLGLSATISHTAIVWIVALLGLHFGQQWGTETTEPYFEIVSAALMLLIAFWMMRRTWKHQHDYADGLDHHDPLHGHGDGPHHDDHSHPHDHSHHGCDHHHDHAHGDDHHHDHDHHHDEDDHTTPVPHHHACHAHDHGTLDLSASAGGDAHALAHADDIKRRFAGREVTTGQIIMFGLTGGLIPCPASVTVLLLCLQLKKVTLGALLVVCFSIGLALTMVSAGVVAALSVRHLSRHSSRFSGIAHRAPYLSGVLISAIAVYIGYHGLVAIL
jgi:nickel/cobalt exporter